MDNMYIDSKKYSASTLLFGGVVAYTLGFFSGIYYLKKKESYLEEYSDLHFLNDSNKDPNQLELDLDFKHSENNYDNTISVKSYNNVLNPPQNPETITVENQPNMINIFKNNDSEWDYTIEEANRTKDKPYVIHQDEYFAGETEYTQSTLTYYAGDDILVDEQETPIYNYKAVVGELKFGHGSEDQNVVYIRNDSLSGEYEVLLDHGSYEIEVLGNKYAEILQKHDLKSEVQKFRPE